MKEIPIASGGDRKSGKIKMPIGGHFEKTKEQTARVEKRFNRSWLRRLRAWPDVCRGNVYRPTKHLCYPQSPGSTKSGRISQKIFLSCPIEMNPIPFERLF
jgi:hypothetical protein